MTPLNVCTASAAEMAHMKPAQPQVSLHSTTALLHHTACAACSGDVMHITSAQPQVLLLSLHHTVCTASDLRENKPAFSGRTPTMHHVVCIVSAADMTRIKPAQPQVSLLPLHHTAHMPQVSTTLYRAPGMFGCNIA